jgi:hypothetical protein
VATQNIEPLYAVCDGVVFNVVNVTAFLEQPKLGEFGYDLVLLSGELY